MSATNIFSKSYVDMLKNSGIDSNEIKKTFALLQFEELSPKYFMIWLYCRRYPKEK